MPLFRKSILLSIFALTISISCFAQDFTEEFESLINTEKPNLLPEKNVNYSKNSRFRNWFI